MEHQLSLTVIVVAVLGIGAQWVAWRLRLPAIVLLALAGLCAGPVFGWIQPSRDFGTLLHPIIGLAVAIILFEGGLNLRFHEFQEAAPGVKRLVSLGVLLSWILGATCAYYIGGLSWPVSLLFGAILVVTGPTVILPLLRQAKLARRPASFLKWEGIINDPVGALLAVLVFEYFVYTGAQTAFPQQVVISLGAAVFVASGLGIGGGYLLGLAFQHGHIPEFLKAPVIFGLVLLVYGGANLAQQEAGLLAATALGIVIGNSKLAGIEELRRFKEYVTVLLVSGVFVLLTADLDPSVLTRLNWRSVALLAAILFVVRPVAVLLSTINAGMEWRERVLVAWIAPRGIVAAAVAGVFAPRMVERGYPDAVLLVPLIFVVIFLTVVAHGFSLGRLARRLGLAAGPQEGVLIVGASPWSTELARLLQEMNVSVLVADSSWYRLRTPRLAGVPVHYGEILSELSDETVDLNDIGYVLAATENDAYNALVCTRFAPELGRDRVFQLAMREVDEGDPNALGRSLRGQVVIGEEVTYEELLRRHYQGWQFQKTRLTDTYSYEDFLREHTADTDLVLILRKSGTIVFATPQASLQPQVGDTLLSFTARRHAVTEPTDLSPPSPAVVKKHTSRAGGISQQSFPFGSIRFTDLQHLFCL